MAKTIRHPELFQLPVAAEGLFKQEGRSVSKRLVQRMRQVDERRIDERLMRARARLAYAHQELAKFWRGSDGIDDGRTAAKLQKDVDRANDDVRTLEARYNAAFGGVE
jgi:hypothetical protein